MFNLIPEQLLNILRAEGQGITIGSRRIDALFYADDLALIASSRNALQKQLYLVEKWLQDCKMEMNADKTEYLVTGEQGGALITSTGERIAPTTSANYLGYVR